MKNSSQKSVVKKWEEALKSEGYEYSVKDKSECPPLKNFSRVWRKILRQIPKDIKAAKEKSVFEFGCGGGKYLIQFLLNNWRVAGIDSSLEVLKRARNYLQEVVTVCGCRGDFKLIGGDFFAYKSNEQCDIVFNAGVVEHFLNDSDRKMALEKMFAITKKKGYIISIVPSGTHPLRQKMREKCLGGYGIPEIDYTPAFMEEEMRQCGGRNILVLPHNIMGYRLIDDKKGFLKLIDLFLYYIFQIIPISFLPKSFAYRHAMTLIGIAQK